MKKQGKNRKIKGKIGLVLTLLLLLTACKSGNSELFSQVSPQAKNENSELFGQFGQQEKSENSELLVYGTAQNITEINPILNEHGELNPLLFNGLTAHAASPKNGENGKKGNIIAPDLAEKWDFDPETCTYTFYLAKTTWHDGEPFTSADVKFTIEAIQRCTQSEIAENFDAVREIALLDENTISFQLEAPNAAFLDYMAVPILPRHLLEGEDLEMSSFFKHPVGTGPYRLSAWNEGESLVFQRNEEYFHGVPNISQIIVKILPNDAARSLQLRTGELDLALLPPREAEKFESLPEFTTYHMETSDYRGILFNFQNPYWQENRDLIPAVCCALDREAMVESILLGRGNPAYGPLQRNIYNNPEVERYSYDPARAEELLQSAGCQKGGDGFYYRHGEKVAFTISTPAGDQVRLDLAQAAAQQLRQVGVDVNVEIPSIVDWASQSAYLLTSTTTPTRSSPPAGGPTTPGTPTPWWTGI